MSKPVIRQSTISQILHCGRQWELSQLRSDNLLPSEALYVGTRVHSALDTFFKLQLENISLDADEIVNGLHAAWESDAARWSTSSTGALLVAEQLVRAYLRWVVPLNIKPTLLDHTLVLETESFTLVGTIDALLSPRTILDFKTADSLDTAQQDLARSIQPWVYTLLKAQGDLLEASKIEFVHHILTKRRPPFMVFPMSTYVSIPDLYMLSQILIPRVVVQMVSGNLFPNPLGRYCSKGLCQVWEFCRAAKIPL